MFFSISRATKNKIVQSLAVRFVNTYWRWMYDIGCAVSVVDLDARGGVGGSRQTMSAEKVSM